MRVDCTEAKPTILRPLLLLLLLSLCKIQTFSQTAGAGASLFCLCLARLLNWQHMVGMRKPPRLCLCLSRSTAADGDDDKRGGIVFQSASALFSDWFLAAHSDTATPHAMPIRGRCRVPCPDLPPTTIFGYKC